MENLVVGIIMAGIGFLMLKFTLWFVTNFGRIDWFERHLRTWGGTFLFYKLIGIMLSFFGILHMVGLLEPFLTWILGSTFGPVFSPTI